MRNTCSPRKRSQDSSNYKSLKSLKKNDVFWIYWQKEHTLSIGYEIWLQNKNTWLSRSRRWMSLNFYFHRYLFFIRVGLICRKQRRFCNCLHVFSKMFLHQVCWKHHCNFLWIPCSLFSLFCLFLAFSLDLSVVLLYFKETTLKYSPRQNSAFDLESINWCDQIVEQLHIFDSITHYYRRKADNTTPTS